MSTPVINTHENYSVEKSLDVPVKMCTYKIKDRSWDSKNLYFIVHVYIGCILFLKTARYSATECRCLTALFNLTQCL